MAINNKIGKHTTVVLVIIVVCFISILCCGVLSSCCEVEASNSQNSVSKQVTINDTEKIKVTVPGMSFVFIKFNYEGHEYFSIPYADYYMMHSPNCSCLKESKVESSSIFDSSPSNSLFNW